MPRRSYHKAEVFRDDQLLAANATVKWDSARKTLVVKNGAEEVGNYTVESGPTVETSGRDRVRTWVLSDSSTLTMITAGCNCGK